MKILVTGGCGYIGSHAVNNLINKGHDVVIIDDLSYGFIENKHPKSKLLKIDLKNKNHVIEAINNEKKIDAIMHFAGYIVVPESTKDPLKYYENNIIGTLNLLEAASRNNIKNIIFSSTAAVYGEPEEIPVKENDILNPINPYGYSKLMCEQIIKDWAKTSNSNYIIFRYFNVAGANDSMNFGIRMKNPTHLIPIISNCVLSDSQKSLKIFGSSKDTRDGTCIRDFVHVDDLVEAHILGLEWSIANKTSSTFNLGSGDGYSVLETFDKAKKIWPTIKYEFDIDRFGDPDILLADISKAIEDLKWKPKNNLETILKSDYDFRRKWNGK